MFHWQIHRCLAAAVVPATALLLLLAALPWKFHAIAADVPNGGKRQPIRGQVVLANAPDKGVKATVWGDALDSRQPSIHDLSTDEDGHFQSERGGGEMLMFVRSTDEKLAGSARIDESAKQITISVGPTASGQGRLLSATTGEPLAGHQIVYGIQVLHQDVGTFVTRFEAKATTADDGCFEVAGLVAGVEYTLYVLVERDARDIPEAWVIVGKIKADKAEEANFGDFRFKRPYFRPTVAELVQHHFQRTSPSADLLRSKLRDAKLGYQRVLLIAASPGGKPAKQLYTLYYGEEDLWLEEEFSHYIQIPVDVSSPDAAAKWQAMADELGLTLPKSDGLLLAVLNDEGQVIAQATDDELRLAETTETPPLQQFLIKHARALPDAEEILAAALRKAKDENKRVLIQHSGPDCAPCLLLSRFLDDQQTRVSKDFVYVKLDDRFRNGEAAIRHLRPNGTGGIPWMVILDADGRPLINSDAADGNIGYPSSEEGVAHFEKMLRTSAQRLTDEDIQTILQPLAVKKDE